MKFLITSDNHLGYKETDPVRKNDTFVTFEEVLQIANRELVDFVIQGGDLFDENKPSRNTYYKTINILKKYCLGSEKPLIRSNLIHNWNDKNVNVSLPIFSIHGNHDDPSGFNPISPLDILSSTGLINYFGKCHDIEEIVIEPIILEKDIKIALYGIGYIKDRKIHSAFKHGKVKFKSVNHHEYFNILVIHQNRTPRDGEYISEDLIEPFFDLVIYGHEHESIKLSHKNFDVIQCGSTVRTSLCEGESYDKFVYIAEISEKVSIKRILLQTVRPLIIDNIKVETGNANLITMSKIELMIDKISSLNSLNNNNLGMIPLLRIRIELGNGVAFDKHKILDLLKNKVANPTDSLRILRKADKSIYKQKNSFKKVEIAEIYNNILSNVKMNTLSKQKIVDTLKDIILKDSKDSFFTMVKSCVEKIITRTNIDLITLDNIESEIRLINESIIKEEYLSNFQLIEDSRVPSNEEEECHEKTNNSLITDEALINKTTNSFLINDETFLKASNKSFLFASSTPSSFTNLSNSEFILASNIKSNSREFTFLEEKNNVEETSIIIKKIKKEQEKINIPTNPSDDEQFTFTSYL